MKPRKPLVVEFPILHVNKKGNWTKNSIACPNFISDKFFVHKFKNGVTALISTFPMPEDMTNELFCNTQAGVIMQQSNFKDRFCVIIDKDFV